MSATFVARYPGRCPACDERIHVGDPLTFRDGGYTVHEDCESIDVQDRPELEPCPVCWLTHQDGACDR